MARPKKPKDARKERCVIFRVSKTQFAALERLAAKAGLRVNAFARLLTLSRGDRVQIKTSSKADPALIAQLGRIGTNLNQLVHNAHIFRRVSPEVARLCRRIEKILDEASDKESNS